MDRPSIEQLIKIENAYKELKYNNGKHKCICCQEDLDDLYDEIELLKDDLMDEIDHDRLYDDDYDDFNKTMDDIISVYCKDCDLYYDYFVEVSYDASIDDVDDDMEIKLLKIYKKDKYGDEMPFIDEKTIIENPNQLKFKFEVNE